LTRAGGKIVHVKKVYPILILAVLSVTGCARQNYWLDATGQGRGAPQLATDTRSCTQLAYDTRMAAIQGIVGEFRDIQYADAIDKGHRAFDDCLKITGWAQAHRT
jgi:hypothetical protein